MTGSEYTSDQLELEQLMSDLGGDKVRHTHAQAISKGMFSVTKTGRSLMRRFIVPCLRILEDSVNATASTDCRRTVDEREVEGVQRMLELGLDKVALVSVQELLNSLHDVHTVQKIMLRIGEAIEDEWRLKMLRRTHPELFKEAKVRMRGKGKMVRRRILLGLDKAMRWDDSRDADDALPPKWLISVRMRIGWICLDAALRSADPPLAEVEMWQEHRMRRTVLIPTDRFREWTEKAIEAAALVSPLNLPMIDEPEPWEAVEGGGYKTELSHNRPIARFHSESQYRAAAEVVSPELPAVKALNNLQRTQWRLNEDVRQVVEHLWSTGCGLGGLPGQDDPPLPATPPGIQGNAKAMAEHRRKKMQAVKERSTVRARRILSAQTRSVAATFARSGGELHFPWRLDFRGRAYPVPYFLQPQGPDLARGLLEFREPHRLTADGWDRLLIHGANVYGEKGTLEHRKGFALGLFRQARETCEDPLEHRFWLDADDPWQFLAWCLEVGSLEDPGRWRELWTRIPCYADGSNNGLQLFALMTGDRKLAELTNAIASPGQPRDVYQEVADRVTESWGEALAAGRKIGDGKADTRLASMWLELYPDGFPRGIPKRTVMTLPYGVTGWSSMRYVRDQYREDWGITGIFGDSPGRACVLLSNAIMANVSAVCEGAVEAMTWLRKAARAIVKTGAEVSWVSPSGWPVTQHYIESDRQKVRLELAGHLRQLFIPIRGRSVSVSPEKQVKGLPPNFVHSIDAAILHRALESVSGPVAAVHDAYAAPAPMLSELLLRVREAVVECALEADPLARMRESTQLLTGKQLPEPPRLGDIGTDEVLTSSYLFS